MTIEKQLEALRKALEIGGAKIEVKFHNVACEEDAVDIIGEFTNHMTTHSRDKTHWIDATVDEIEIVAYYNKSKEERIRELEQQLSSLKEHTA